MSSRYITPSTARRTAGSVMQVTGLVIAPAFCAAAIREATARPSDRERR